MKCITFKAKPFPLWNAEGTEKRQAIQFKRTLKKSDCNLRPHEHVYYNCDMFPSMLNRYYQGVLKGRTWAYVDSLPDGVLIDTSKFLAVITIPLPDNFR